MFRQRADPPNLQMERILEEAAIIRIVFAHSWP